MKKNPGTKLVGAALSVTLLAGASAPEQLDSLLAAQHFTETGRYIGNIAACIASSPRSTMTNPNTNQLDNAQASAGPNGMGSDQPIHVNIRRDGQAPDGPSTWFAHYNVAPGNDDVLVVQTTGHVPRSNAFWSNAPLGSGESGLSTNQVRAGASELVPDRIGIAAGPKNAIDATVEKRGNNYYYWPDNLAPHPGPLEPQEFDAFMKRAHEVGDHLLELSGVDTAACNLG